MALEIKEGKVNPSRNYATSVPTLSARPLAVTTDFAEGRRIAARGRTAPPTKATQAKNARRGTAHKSLRVSERTILP